MIWNTSHDRCITIWRSILIHMRDQKVNKATRLDPKRRLFPDRHHQYLLSLLYPTFSLSIHTNHSLHERTTTIHKLGFRVFGRP
jgi:hypothetical protein